MSRENNFLLGKGELLTQPVTVPSGGGSKKAPYTINEAQQTLSKQLNETQTYFSQLPPEAKPGNTVVAKLTLHPRYLSKSDYPKELLRAFDFKTVGSKTEKITPRKWGIKKHPESTNTESYFIAGKEEDFSNWNQKLHDQSLENKQIESIIKIEKISVVKGEDKFKGVQNLNHNCFEIVLHNAHDNNILDFFIVYCNKYNGKIDLDKIRTIDGLTFLPVFIENKANLHTISDFTFVRAARSMPTLRTFHPITSMIKPTAIILPNIDNITTSYPIKAAIFDGGLENPSLLPWVNYIEPPGIGKADPNSLKHGLAVTGAYLFGSIHPDNALPLPVSKVDHIRVLDENSGKNPEIIDVLDRITHQLENNSYDVVNISLGPNLPIDDDEVTLWTATLDTKFATGDCVATVAVGNNGEQDKDSGLNRIQIPADAVNVISVGACDTTNDDWDKTDYSAYGPGRCPGKMKPDVLAFGGSQKESFKTLALDNNKLILAEMSGTSFSAPLLQRSISGLRATLGTEVSHLSLRALVIHNATSPVSKLHLVNEIGWGRAEIDPLKMITSEDNEATLLYQGELLVSNHLRVTLPLQDIELMGKIKIKATLVISPEIDSAFPGSYTRHGVEVTFRPHDRKYKTNPNGKRSTHPASYSFFSKSAKFNDAEYAQKENGNKWEPILKHEEIFNADKLSNPTFDIYYHYREMANKAKEQKPIPYSLLVTISSEDDQGLYNKITRQYANILQPYKPQNRIQLSI